MVRDTQSDLGYILHGHNVKITFPFWSRSLVGIISALSGIVVSYVADIPTGPTIALLLVVTFITATLSASVQTKLFKHHD